MPTSGCCRRNKPARGFTLLELLVVLALMALATSLVAPRLWGTLTSVAARNTRDGIAAQLDFLGYRAFALGVPVTLSADTAGRVLPDGEPVLALPAGWRLATERPIEFSLSGFCEGGSARLISPERHIWRVDFQPPACRATLTDDDAER